MCNAVHGLATEYEVGPVAEETIAALRDGHREAQGYGVDRTTFRVHVPPGAEHLMAGIRQRGLTPVPYVVGRKGQSYFRFRGVAMQETWTGVSEVPPYDAAELIPQEQIAPLLRKLLEQYSATGLPPAYLPQTQKEES